MTNHLAGEKSPYLRQHASNPVNWYPWGEEAFEEARRSDKPVFLSIGYSTCHWCHVMEEESFEDEEVAALMNAGFVAIKVDREERPDVDAYYMNVAQAMTGRGGWPLTVVMTPDKRPFFAATYLPKVSRPGATGLLDLLPAVTKAWASRRGEVETSGDSLAGAMRSFFDRDLSGDAPTAALHDAAFESFRRDFDSDHGGFGTRPKFPSAHNLVFLLRYGRRTGNAEATTMALRTLDALRWSGIYDHVGGGFHRYSTDEGWHLPHFEKMLYDQAMAILAYVEATRATGDPRYAAFAADIADYVLRDLKAPEGFFRSAEDADSEGEEGTFYLWSLADLLSMEGGDELARSFGATAEGNFSEEATGEKTGTNVLDPVTNAYPEGWERLRTELAGLRDDRVRPSRDDKGLTDWNGLMISALSALTSATGKGKYLDAARKAADFFMHETMSPDGDLLHRFMEGEAAIPGFLDDYAFLAAGLLDLYGASFDPRYLETAVNLVDRMTTLFSDDDGSMFLTRAGGDVPARAKQSGDGALPAGSSVAYAVLNRLYRLTGRLDFRDRAEALERSSAGMFGQAPGAFGAYLAAAETKWGDPTEIVIVGDPDSPELRAMVDAVTGDYLPGAVVLVKNPGENLLDVLAPYSVGYRTVDGKAAAYVCRDFSCELPVTDPASMLKLVDGP